jgi:hypothetical protein
MKNNQNTQPKINIIKITKEYGWEIIKYSWLISIISFFVGFYMYYTKKNLPIIYTASLSFSVNEGGVPVNSANKEELENIFNMSFGSSNKTVLMELLKTRRVLELVFFEKVKLKGKDGKIKEDYFIHHYLDLFGHRDNWKKNNPKLAKVYFRNDSTENFTVEENILLVTAFNSIVKKNLSDETSPAGIRTLKFNSTNEEFSYTFLRKYYDILNNYYTEKSTEKQRGVFDAAKARRDSLEQEMNRAERDYISYLNTHNLSAQGQHAEKIEIQYLARKLSGEMEGYFMAIKNVEIAKSALDLQRPLLQAIDKPIYPLERTNPPSAIMALILGIIIGFVLGVVLVIGQKLGRDLWKNNKQKILDNFNGNTNNDSTSLESKLPTP